MRRLPPLAVACALAGVLLGVPSAWGARRAESSGGSTSGALFALLAMLCVALALLGIAMLLAMRAAAPAKPKPRRKSFEAGRLAAMRAPPLTEADALARVRAGDLGDVADARVVPGKVVLRVKRPRGQSCEGVAGRLAGMFEAAWARDVLVEHTACGGKKRAPCTFVVTRREISVGGRRAEGASTRGW